MHQIYQCTEGLLAISCRAGALHLQEDLVSVQLEPLESEGEGEGESERFTPIVTDLWRRTQPIIRYRLNDVVKLSAQAMLVRVGVSCAGADRRPLRRCPAFSRTGRQAARLFPDTIRRMVLLGSVLVLNYQAYQEKPGHLRASRRPAEADFGGVARSLGRVCSGRWSSMIANRLNCRSNAVCCRRFRDENGGALRRC